MTDSVCREAAEAEFQRFCEAMCLDVDESTMDDEDKAGLRRSRDLFVRAVMQGRLTLNDECEPVYHYQPDEGDAVDIVFHEPCGKDYQAADKGKKDQNVARAQLIMASQTRQPPKLFSSMRNRHFQVCMAITQLFLS